MIFLDLAAEKPGAVTEPLHPFDREDEYVDSPDGWLVKCGKCGTLYGTGCSPCCKDGHAPVASNYGKGFEPHFCEPLGRWVTTWGDVRKGMREQHLDFAADPKPGQIQDRIDRCRAEREKRG